MAGAQFVQTLMLTGQFLKGEDDAVQANQVALEGVRSIKVVNAYSLQKDLSNRFAKVRYNSLVNSQLCALQGVQTIN